MYASLRRPVARRGSIVPMLAMCVVALFSFVALSIDLGMLMIARTECQNAADTAALTGARVLDNNYPSGTNPNSYDNKAPDAITAARASVQDNVFLNRNFTAAQVTKVQVGVYDYYAAAQTFAPLYDAARTNLFPRFGTGTKPSGKAWSCCRVEVDGTQTSYFARVFGVNSMPMAAYAVAVHRPRDIALVLDFSGSMRFSSVTHWETGNGGSTGQVWGLLNPDPYYPQFGHYARYTDISRYQITNPSPSAVSAASGRPNPLRMTSEYVMGSGETCAPNNHTIAGRNGPAVVGDFRFDPNGTVGGTVNTSALRNAFNRWNGAVPVPGNANANLPPENDPGNPNSYIAPTYSFGGYNAFDTTSTNGPTPAPDSFRNQSNAAGVNYVGDRYPRKRGVEFTNDTSWDPTTTNGAAINLAEFLGWCPRFTGTWTGWPGSPPARTTFAAPNGVAYAADWSTFRDTTWERYGYDLDVADYITNRNNGTTWDPLFDAGLAKDTNANTPNPPTSSTYSPSVTPGKFQGYSMGPGYWGKTFYVWPPDPRPAHDWRRRFFRQANGTSVFDPQAADNDSSQSGDQPSIDATLLNQASATNVGHHSLNTSTRYTVNYNAVLAWIKSGPQTLPPNLRAGRIVYYSSIPNDVAFTGGSTAALDLDKRFWREYIDFVLGNARNTNYDPRFCLAGVELNRWPDGAPTNTPTATVAYDPDGASPYPVQPRPYINYAYNPNRPRMHFWFGPASMIAFLATRTPNKNWWAGTLNEAQAWQLKAGIQSGVEDIRKNHPNDQAGMAYFAWANFTTTRVTMGQDWDSLRNALFYPHSMLAAIKGGNTTTELRPYNASFGSSLTGNIPNSNGGTDPNAGLALGYNLLSSRTASPSLTGRRGASKIVIFETDGVPNSSQSFVPVHDGPNSYYNRTGNGAFIDNGDPGVMQDAYNVVSHIVAPVNNSAGTTSGFSLPNSPARVYSIAFGDLFDPDSTAAFKPTALTFLLNVQKAGNTSASSDASIPSQQIITGPYQTRIDNLKNALERIFQSGVQVTLIE